MAWSSSTSSFFPSFQCYCALDEMCNAKSSSLNVRALFAFTIITFTVELMKRRRFSQKPMNLTRENVHHKTSQKCINNKQYKNNNNRMRSYPWVDCTIDDLNPTFECSHLHQTDISFDDIVKIDRCIGPRVAFHDARLAIRHKVNSQNGLILINTLSSSWVTQSQLPYVTNKKRD